MPSGTLDEQLDALARSLSDSSLPGRGLGLSSRRAVMEMLTAFSLGPGPNWTTSDSQTGDPWTHVDRRIGAALDLGPTLAQPVLLITGFLSRASLPVDLTLDGWPIESSQGEIMVRWIHPLPDTAAVQVGEPVQR